MKNHSSVSTYDGQLFASNLPADVQIQLGPDETVLALLELDLDTELKFRPGLLLVTDRAVVAHDPLSAEWRRWPLADTRVLTLSDHAGAGALELYDNSARLAVWRYTLGRNPAALRLLDAYTRRHAQLSAQARAGLEGCDAIADQADTDVAADADIRVCPSCQTPIPAGQEECPSCGADAVPPSSTWALLRLWRFAHPYRLPLITGFVLTVLATAATLVAPYLTMPLMDDVLIPFQSGAPIDYDRVRWLLIGLLGSALLAWVLGWARTYILAWVSERIGADMRTATYAHLQNLSLEYFGGKRTGDLIARIGSETDRICVFLSLHLLDFATDVLMIVMTAAILISINHWLALVTLVPLPFIAWMIHVVRDHLRHGFEKVDRVWSEITNVLADTIPGIRVVKAFAQEKREVQRFRDANNRNLEVNDRVNTVWALFSPTVTLLTEIGLLVVWIYGIWQVSNHQITVGVLAAFLAYIGRFYTRLDSMSRIVSVTQKAAAGAKRIFDILDHVSSVPEPARPVPVPHVEGRIELKGVGFRYGNRSVIRGLDLTIAPGKMVGLVGHSGSGKSTLINLICRFYDVSEGAILVDGVDIRAMSIAQYRGNIGLVLQEPFLFFGTIAENIAYGKPDATREDIIAAARAAHAHEFILRLPHGYDSLVGERGQALSGGERQRISIARALLIDPRILILDEATSSVDTATEKEIQIALDNLVRGRTTIAIAHRLSTLRKADQLVVLDRGQIVEQGGHDELMAREGAYYRLYQAQARAAEAESQTDDDDDDLVLS
ncbi:ABC transporter transmembrane domain-containing protein [Bordetella sp. N]|uniref:cyanophycin metabolism-associated ABC transporter n=1 Tax=Bordetella sp. N TaxID=1746199 RepID=UPI00070FE765|nr:ABC transporter transmembrane domain-containing protein [Bordetella sp. N]ALM81801.1 ABC transporter [Bordetella sp. N]